MKIIKWRNLKLSPVAYEKLIHLMFIHKVVTWHCVHVSLLWYFSHSVSFFFINCFIGSLFLFILSHTLFLCTSLKPLLSLFVYLYLLLNLSFPLRIAIILLLFLHISLSLTFSLFGTTSDYASLYLCDIIPLLLSFLLWYDNHYYCSPFVLIIVIF